MAGKGKSTHKRDRKVLKDNIQGVTKSAIRRLARRGGVKRISATIYSEIRAAIKQRLEKILKQCAIVVQATGPQSGRKTITVPDIVFVLNRMGTPIYGFGES